MWRKFRVSHSKNGMPLKSEAPRVVRDLAAPKNLQETSYDTNISNRLPLSAAGMEKATETLKCNRRDVSREPGKLDSPV